MKWRFFINYNNYGRTLAFLMRPDWHIHYSRWIIEDGEPDRHVGEIFDWFAIAFSAEQPLGVTDQRSRAAVPTGDNAYRVVAEVIYVSERECIIDFGLKATSFSDLLPPHCECGDFVTGEVWLKLPLCTEVGPDEPLKNIAYRWRVNRILADLTPYVQHSNYPGGYVRDASNVRYQDVPDTDSVKAHSYVLHCSEVLV